MKNLKLFILLLTISVVSFSCGSDDDGGSGGSDDNVLVFGDTEFQLESGAIIDYGEYYDGIYNFDIYLMSTGITVSNGDFTPDDDTFSGVYFELFTDNAADLEDGVYAFGSTVEANSYTYADVFINSTEDEYNGYDITSGTFTVLDNGSSYEFEFEGTVDGGETFSGYYKGSLEALDYSSEDRVAIVSNAKKTRKTRTFFKK